MIGVEEGAGFEGARTDDPGGRRRATFDSGGLTVTRRAALAARQALQLGSQEPTQVLNPRQVTNHRINAP